MIVDKHGVTLSEGSVIDINQTVNGCNLFFIKSVCPLDIRYNHDRERRYEYDPVDLLSPCRFSGDVGWEIINKEKNQPDGSSKICEECGKYPADLPSNLCCGCNEYKEHLS